MRVLFINRPKNLWIGGDYIQLEKTAEALRLKGVEVDISETPLPTPAIGMYRYDIVHLWNFSMAWSKLGLWAAKSKGLKAVCSMIYHEKDDFVSYPDQQIMIDNLDAALFLTEGELERVKRHLTIKDNITHFIPNGIDNEWFEEKSQESGKFALTVGRIEDFKGQVAVARVCKKLGIKYRCIGEVVTQSVADELQSLGAELITPKTPDELQHYYRECQFYILASRAELMPLTVMEAGAKAKNIILTDHCEWELPGVEYVEYKNEAEIEVAIVKTLKKEPNVELQELLKTMTWDKVADRLIEIYKKVQPNEK